MTLLEAPPVPQHMLALAKANEVRLARAVLKRRVAAGEVTVADILRDPPVEAQTMTLAELLTSQRRWGHTRATKLLDRVAVSEAKQVGALSKRQRQWIIDLLTGVVAPPARAPKMPSIVPGERQRDEAMIVLVLIGQGGRTSAEIDLALRGRRHAVTNPDLVTILNRMVKRGIVWRDQSTGFALYGVDRRYSDATD